MRFIARSVCSCEGIIRIQMVLGWQGRVFDGFERLIVVLGAAGCFSLGGDIRVDGPALLGDFGQVTGPVAGNQHDRLGLFYGGVDIRGPVLGR